MTKKLIQSAYKINDATGAGPVSLIVSMLEGGLPESEVERRCHEAAKSGKPLGDMPVVIERDRSKSFKWNF